MTGSPSPRVEALENGLTLEFRDRSNRYFGDYHRVRIEVRIRVSLRPGEAPLGPSELLDRARKVFGEEAVEVRYLERMGVAGAAVDETREALIGHFLATVKPYLIQPSQVLRLLGRLLAGRSIPRRPGGLP